MGQAVCAQACLRRMACLTPTPCLLPNRLHSIGLPSGIPSVSDRPGGGREAVSCCLPAMGTWPACGWELPFSAVEQPVLDFLFWRWQLEPGACHLPSLCTASRQAALPSPTHCDSMKAAFCAGRAGGRQWLVRQTCGLPRRNRLESWLPGWAVLYGQKTEGWAGGTTQRHPSQLADGTSLNLPLSWSRQAWGGHVRVL